MIEATYSQQWDFLKSLSKNNAHSSFWMFVGERGCGKFFFASKWIRYWVRCHDIAADPHVCVVQIKDTIKVDDIKKIRTFLSAKND